MSHTRSNESIRENTRNSLLRTFKILFFTGLRLNEIQTLIIKYLKELIKSGITKL